jgi:hypothetical protein
MNWPFVSRKKYEADLKAERQATLRAEAKLSRFMETDGRPYKQRNEGMISVPVSACAIAWSIVKERRDALCEPPTEAERMQAALTALHEAGFDNHLPTLAEVRGIWSGAENGEGDAL